MSDIHRFENPHDLALGAADFVAKRIEAVQGLGRPCSLALSGGSTPEATYRALAAHVGQHKPDWGRVRIFWGDERCVPPDDPASNYRMARLSMLDELPIPDAHVFRMACEDDPETGAAAYESTLRDQFGKVELPRFDLILLGLGPEGHTASLFPGSSALESRGRWVKANYVKNKRAWRMTLSMEVINAAAAVAFLVQGEEKADILRRVVKGGEDARSLPAAHIQPVSGELHWFVDAAAAAAL